MSISRRSFLASATGTALVLQFPLHAKGPAIGPHASPSPLDSCVCINPDGTAVIQVCRAEMGQGVFTSLPMIFAEEAELDWSKVTATQSLQTEGTGGSSSVTTSYLPLRQAGAAVREMMITAAANRWRTAKQDCSAKLGCVIHLPSGRKLTYGDLVSDAKQLPVPATDQLRLKNPADFRLIGTPAPRLDVPDKVTGSAKYGIDIRLPGMRFAVIARPPRKGSTAVHYDASKTLRVPGVLKVFPIEPRSSDSHTRGGVVVVATSTWAARKGREALQIEWSNSPFIAGDSEELSAEFDRALNQQPPDWSWRQGAVSSALDSATRKVEAVYEFPFLAHATMEPMNTTIHRKASGCEVWCPTQAPKWARTVIAKELGLPEEKVIVHTTLMGGGFGRRYAADYPNEAAQIAKQIADPVQLVWTREDDFTNDLYRPASRHHLTAGFSREQLLTVWEHRMTSTSLAAQGNKLAEERAESSEVTSAMDPSFLVPNFSLHYTQAKTDVPRGAWRSVGHSFNVAVNECFIDELAHAANQDPYTFRRNLLISAARDRNLRSQTKPYTGDGPPDLNRLLTVLDLAAEKSNWHRPLDKNQGRGIACAALYGGYLAQVARVTVQNGTIAVDRIVVVVDCGQVINSDGVKAQIEGATIFALSAALKEQITVKNGVVQQQNFDTYPLLRLPEAPALEIFVIESHLDPCGLGEAGVPLVGASVANAVFSACGERLRKWPLRLTASAT